MRLINTEGLAIFGPGSEWFWTMLQFTALAITLIAIYRQLQAQQAQMRDNTKVLQSHSHYNSLRLSNRSQEMLIESDTLSRIVTTGYATPAALNDSDWARFAAFVLLIVDSWEYMYYEHRDGAIPQPLWVGADAYFKRLVQTKPGLVRFWAELGMSYDEPFHSYVAREFTKKTEPTVPAAEAPVPA